MTAIGPLAELAPRIGAISEIRGVAVVSDGYWATEPRRLERRTRTGAVLIDIEEPDPPDAIFRTKPAVDSVGNVWVVREPTTGEPVELARYTSGGVLSLVWDFPPFASVTGTIHDIAIDADDALWVLWERSSGGGPWFDMNLARCTLAPAMGSNYDVWTGRVYPPGRLDVDLDGETLILTSQRDVVRRSGVDASYISELTRPAVMTSTDLLTSACGGFDGWTFVAVGVNTSYVVRLKAGDVFTYQTSDPEVSDSHPVWQLSGSSWTRPSSGVVVGTFQRPNHIVYDPVNGDTFVSDELGIHRFGLPVATVGRGWVRGHIWG